MYNKEICNFILKMVLVFLEKLVVGILVISGVIQFALHQSCVESMPDCEYTYLLNKRHEFFFVL